MPTSHSIRGAKRIAAVLGYSEKTILRWISSGRLKAKKLGGVTSPIIVERSEIDRLKAGHHSKV